MVMAEYDLICYSISGAFSRLSATLDTLATPAEVESSSTSERGCSLSACQRSTPAHLSRYLIWKG